MELINQIPPQVKTAIRLLNENGFSAYVVGGAVRDAVMGNNINDWDITTSALPEETEKVFSDYRYFETGIKHGTITVLIDKMPLEITTYRIEKGYSDRRRPDEVIFTDNLKEDLSRRDFTCNAMALHPEKGIVDYFGGKSDIENKIIRCVGEADKRFNEDALRILRALRFASVLSFDIESDTAESIRKNYRLLEFISKERIFVELCKLLCGKNVKKILLEYSEVFFFILPCLEKMKGCKQNHPRHIYDVWEHTVNAVTFAPPVPEMRMAMLFHDCGKPQAKSTDEKGIDHFYNHSAIGREICHDALCKLKTSLNFRRKVCDFVEFHDFVPSKISKKTYKKHIGLLGIDTVKELFLIREADIRAQSPDFIEEGLAEIKYGLSVIDEIEKNEACFTLKDLAINGSELMENGFEGGPCLGTILSLLLNEVMDNKLENNKSALLKRAKELNINGNS